MALPPFMQKIGGLFSEPQVNGGIFGDGAASPYDPRMAFASELLAQSGYAPYKRPFGEMLGLALQQAQKARALGVSQQQQDELRKAQIANLQAETASRSVPQSPFGNIDPSRYTPESIAKFQQTHSYGDLMPRTDAPQANPPGELQMLDAINKDRATRGEQPMRPEEFLASRRGVSADAQLYAQYSQAATERGEKPLPMDQFLTRFRGNVSASQTGAEETQKRLATQISEGYRAADALPVVRRGIELLDSVKTGGLDAIKLRATNLFGVTGADEAELSANLGKAVLSQLRATFGSAFTAGEGERLAEIEAGFGKSTEGNRRLLGQAEKLVERVANRGISAATQSKNDFDVAEITKAMQMSLSEHGGSSGAPKVTSDADYEKLASGTRFVDPEGNVRVKP